MSLRTLFIILFETLCLLQTRAQDIQNWDDTVQHSFLPTNDTILRIRNLNPYFTLHVDSILLYQFEINLDPQHYYWYVKNSPPGLKINKDNGLMSFKAERSYFLTGKLKYDVDYKVNIGVQNLFNPADKIDTSFTLLFYNTEITPSRVKPTVGGYVNIDEGDTLSFRLQCENGNFPIQQVNFTANFPLQTLSAPVRCGDEFKWFAPYDFIKENDTATQKTLILNFIGSDQFSNKDTAQVRVVVRKNINYPEKVNEYNLLRREIDNYILELKGTFMVLDKNLKSTKSTRTIFDISSSSMALGGTILTTVPESEGLVTAGKVMPSVGVALVPVKEAVAPNKVYEQNSASLVRSSIKRLEYQLSDNVLMGNRDPEIMGKTRKLRDELKQVQVQLIDVPIVEFDSSAEELDKYFNNPKINKKYRLKNK